MPERGGHLPAVYPLQSFHIFAVLCQFLAAGAGGWRWMGGSAEVR